MILREKYQNDAKALKDLLPFEGSILAGWRSPSNIALVKYWGKKAGQIPANASLSFTLNSSYTDTFIHYDFKPDDKIRLDFTFNGKPNPLFEKRILNYVESIRSYLPFLNQLHLSIESSNSFPHSSGIASSASSMSALALCLVQIEHDLFGSLANERDFYQKASFLARLASGSAGRSLYGGFVAWGYSNAFKGSSDEVGMEITLPPSNSFNTLRDAILITNSSKKRISSSQGHKTMENHPFANGRYQQAKSNINLLKQAILTENDEKFIRIIENEALSLHALMLSADTGYTLLNQNTWNIIDEIRKFREENGMFISFTLDAGPNVHLIYKQNNKNEIETFIQERLLNYCENGYWINDKIGSGPKKIS